MHSTFDIDGNDEARSSTWLDVSVCPSKVTHWPQSSRVVKIKCRLHVLVPKRANCPCAYGTVPFAHGYPSAYGAHPIYVWGSSFFFFDFELVGSLKVAILSPYVLHTLSRYHTIPHHVDVVVIGRRCRLLPFIPSRIHYHYSDCMIIGTFTNWDFPVIGIGLSQCTGFGGK
jgi:hypothetical protein